MKEYFVKVFVDGDMSCSVENVKELSELWENNNECGYLDSIIAYDPDTMKEVNVYDIAKAYISIRDERQREYEEYCEYINEYGYDYRDEMPEYDVWDDD